MPNVPAARNYKGGFAASLMMKDLGLAIGAGQQCQAPLPLTDAALDLYKRLAEEAGPATDFSGVFQYVYGGQPRGE